MKKEIADKWVKALRSGKYRQGRGVMKGQIIDDSAINHCCLGVLCEIALESGVNMATDSTKSMTNIVYRFGREGRVGTLPIEVTDWANIDSNPESMYGELAILNDQGESFEKIADIIEERYEEL